MTLPFESGVYSVAPGLRVVEPPSTSIDNLPRYYADKLEAASKRTVYLEQDLLPATKHAAVEQLCTLLTGEHPQIYVKDHGRLVCAALEDDRPLTLEEIPFIMTADLAVMQVVEEREYLAAGHVCLPSSWRLEDKIGRPFAQVHQPVPGIPLQGASAMVRSLALRGPYERVAWGLTNFDILDQQAGIHADVQPFPLFIRLERQTIHPLPGCNAWLFLIHPVNIPVSAITVQQRLALASAVASMTPEQAEYKGLGTTRSAVIEALRTKVAAE